MSLNKNLLAATIGAMLFAGAAQAQVAFEFPQTTPNDAISVARELKNGQTLTPAPAQDAVDNLAWTVGYNFSAGEVRYGSLKCSSNVTLAGATITVNDPDNAPASDISLGAINGQGTSTLFFSMTAANPLADTNTDNIQVLVDANVTLLDKQNVTCQFGIYDTPSQAQLGAGLGTAGTIFTTGMQAYITRADSYVFAATASSDTADVEAVPAYTQFIQATPAVGNYNTNVRLALATVVPLNKQLVPVALADLFSAGITPTTITIAGDFSAAAAGGAGAPLNGVAATSRTATLATYTYGTAALPLLGVNGAATFVPNGTSEIQISNYVAQFNPVFTTDYELMQTHVPLNAGDILRNGTELVAPLAQVPTGWISRIVLNNTGSVSRTYRIDLIPGTSGSASEASTTFTGSTSVTGLTIAAGQTRVLSVADLFPGASFTGPARGTIRLRAEAPRGQMNGLYQIVNPASGSISNHVMVQSGTN